MAVYKYKATKSSTGRVIESIIYADNAEDAFQKIMEMGYAPESLAEITAPDRRLNERLDVELTVIFSRFKQGQAPGKKRQGSTHNISSGGLLFKSAKEYPQATVLDIELKMPEGMESIKCLCRVIRCDQINQDENFNIAVCFLDLPNAERTRIDDYVTKNKK
jgi:c-di-GMP-binding flagellar brake protein YcgR